MVAEIRCCVVLKVGNPVELVMVVEGLEMQIVLGLMVHSVIGVEIAW